MRTMYRLDRAIGKSQHMVPTVVIVLTQGIMPGSSSVPDIKYVLPDPVYKWIIQIEYIRHQSAILKC